MMKLRGYNTSRGYVGFFPDGTWMLFVSQGEYAEYYSEHYAEGVDSVA